MNPIARQQRLLVQEVGDELVIYDQDRDRAHTLNPTAALVWRNSDGATSVAQLAAIVANRFGAAADEELVWLALDRLERARLLETPVQRSPADRALTRREAVRRFGLAGAAALMLPAVTSIAAPTPVMAQSGGGGGCGQQGTPCTSNSDCCQGLICIDVNGVMSCFPEI